MMKKIYHLSTCKTCQRIIKELQPGSDVVLQDIKTEKITPSQLKEMYKLAGSYEALFSKRSMKYRAMKLNERTLTEDDMKGLILEEYTFLKRPVIIVDDVISVGSAKKEVDKVRDLI